MNIKRIASIAIIAALPFTAMAENIQGNMYTAPASETNLTPAPTTNADAPYGRINIDTDDQEHIATTAYVKGAYNSAIAAVNKVQANLDETYDEFNDLFGQSQGQLTNSESGDGIDTIVIGEQEFVNRSMGGDTGGLSGNELATATGILYGINEVRAELNSKTVPIYTTWDTNATTNVSLQ